MGPPIDSRYHPSQPTRQQFDEVPEEESTSAREDDEYGEDTTDSPAGTYSVRRRTYERVFQRNVSTTDEVMNQAPDYISSFIVDMMDQDGVNVPSSLRAQTGNVNKDAARCLRQIGDDLSNNQQLNNLISQITISKDTAFETFSSVASQIFSDGVINWGRIVALLYFAYKLVVRVLFDGGLLKTIIKWVVRFISERLVKWITQEGGWTACKSYFGSTPAQMVGVFLAGCLLTALVFWLKK